MNSVEKLEFVEGNYINILMSEIFASLADVYARQDIGENTFREIISKIAKLRKLYDLPGEIKYVDGEPVIYIDLTGENLETILDEEEEVI